MAFRSLSEDIRQLQHMWSKKQGTPQQAVERFVSGPVSELPGVVHQGGFLIQKDVPGPLIEAVDPGNKAMRYGLGVDEPGKLRMYIPEKDGAASLNLSVMTDAVNRRFEDVVSLARQPDAADGGYALKLNNVNEITMNGKPVNMQAVVDRLQFQTHVDKVMSVSGTGASTTPFVTFNPDTRSVGISAVEPKGRLTLGTGGGAGAKGGDMVWEVGNTHDGQNPGFSAINWNGYYDRGEQVFDNERARWRVGVMPDDRFFIDGWKKGMGAPRTVLRASATEDVVDVNERLRISGKYSGWAEQHPERAELVVDKESRSMVIRPPNGRVTVKGDIMTEGRLQAPELEIGAGDRRLNLRTEQGRIVAKTNDALEFVQNNQARLMIARNGNVGVNTSTPNSQLHVEGPVQIGGFVLSPEQSGLKVRNAETNAELAMLARLS